MTRTTKEVFLSHLLLVADWDIEMDIKTNYAQDCVIITSGGVFYGSEGVLQSRQILDSKFSEADFLYTTRHWAGEIAFLEWQAEADDFYIDDGVETFYIHKGLICAQTIHFSVNTRGKADEMKA